MASTLRDDLVSSRPVSVARTPTDITRNCCRCGQEFQSPNRELVCSDCRKPKITRHLSFREKQIVDLVRQAKANKEIAFELHLSEGTVKEYMNRIFRKLEVKSRTELAIWSLTQA